MMGLAGLLGTVELKSRWSVCLWLFVPPEPPPQFTTHQQDGPDSSV